MQKGRGYLWRDGRFLSPVEELLPREAKQSHVRQILPLNHTKQTPMLVHFAGTGDEGHGMRTFLLAKPLAKHGIGSIILEQPYYGVRKPKNQNGAFLRTVTDLFKMVHGAIEEGRSIIKWLHTQNYSHLAVTGISMGGNTALLVGSLVDWPLAVIPCVPTYSPVPVFFDLLLSTSVDWDVLKREPPPVGADTIKYLRERFSLTDIRNFPPPLRPDWTHIITGKADGYVPKDTAEIILNHWKGAKSTELHSGHVATVAFRSGSVRKIIVSTINKMVHDIAKGPKSQNDLAS